MGLCESVTYMCMWRLSGSQKFQPQQNFLSDFLFFQVTYQYLRLFAILASYMTYSFSPRVLNLNWKNLYFCAQLQDTSRDPFFLFAPFFFCALRLAETMHWNNSLKQCTETMGFLQNSGFLLCYSMGFSNLDTRMYRKSFYFHLQWRGEGRKKTLKDQAIPRSSFFCQVSWFESSGTNNPCHLLCVPESTTVTHYCCT